MTASLLPLPEDERVLLLLGLLTGQDRHGYELGSFIENQLGCVTDLKKATAYQLLDRLEQHGLIESRNEQHGARPVRKVYTLTPAGHSRFLQLLATQLPQEEPLILPGNIPLMFCEHLPEAERRAAMQQRAHRLHERLGSYAALLALPQLSPGVRLAVERIQALTRADLEWTGALLNGPL